MIYLTKPDDVPLRVEDDGSKEVQDSPRNGKTATQQPEQDGAITFRLVHGLDAPLLEDALVYAERHSGVSHRTQAFYLYDMKDRGMHQKLGFSSAVGFAENRLDMSPGKARDLIAVGGALEELEQIDEAFRKGELSWSKTRLLCRIALPETERVWIERARALSCRDLEREIKASDKGLPPKQGSKGLPAVRMTVKFKLDALTHEMWEQARRRMAAEQGEPVSEAELARILCSRFLASPAPEAPQSGERVNAALFHVVVDQCPECRASAVRTDAGPVAIEPAVGARLATDPKTPKVKPDGDAGESLRMERGIDREATPKERREILARDGYRCRPCGSRKDLTVHHIIYRSRGGRTTPGNLVATCTPCHALIHEDLMVIRGTAPHGLEITDADGRPLNGGPFPGETGITVLGMPGERARARADADAAGRAEVRFDELPAAVPRDWWERHLHLLSWNERRNTLDFEPGVPIEPAEEAKEAAAASSLRFRRLERPAGLTDFIGQERIVGALKLAARAAHVRAEPVDHALFEGPAGLGKTSLAGALAREMGTRLWTTSGPLLGDVSVLAILLTSLGERGVVFIDEIHALPRRVAEVLYEAMEDGTLSLPVSCGSRTKTLTIELAPFTLIGATTDPDRVPAPLRARFGIQETLESYSDDEVAAILRRTADRDGLEIDADALETLARAALGTPRQALRLWRRVRDAACAHVRARITVDDVRAALDGAGIDERGLGSVHRKILGVLEGRRGRPLGTQRLAALASVSARALRTVFEPELLRLGLLSVTPRGVVAMSGA